MKIRKASKVLALVLTVAMALALMPVMMVSAATIDPVAGIGTITGTLDTVAKTVTFTVPYTMTAIEGTDQVTLLVTKDSADITYSDVLTNTQPSNIAYIDQVPYSATSSFTFIADIPAATATYYVKVGGTDITTPASATKVITIDSNGGFTVSGTVSSAADAINSGDATIDAELNTAWATTITLKPSFLSTTVTATATVDPATKSYTLSNIPNGNYVMEIKRVGYLSRYVPVVVNGGNLNIGDKVILAGDLNGDYQIEGSDSEALFSAYGTAYGDAGYNISYDIFGDGQIEGSDSEALFANYGLDVSTYGENVDFEN